MNIEQIINNLPTQKPLTYEQILELKVTSFPNTYNVWDFVRFVRAVELIHGIK